LLQLADTGNPPPTTATKLVISMTGAMFSDIHLIVPPLLVLTANQITEFPCALISHGSVMAHNLDDQAFSSRTCCNFLMNYLLEISMDTSKTVYFFASPHFLASHAVLLDTNIHYSRHDTL
jgi:hypothetical protein